MNAQRRQTPFDAAIAVFIGHPSASLLLLVLLAYGPTLAYGLTGFDDWHLLANARGAANPGLLFMKNTIVFPGGLFYYRPMMLLSFWATEWAISHQLWCHHAINIIIHYGACLGLFWLLTALGISAGRSLAAAALVAVHPALTLAVASLPGRNDSLLALFLFPAFVAAWRFLEGRRWPWLLLALAAWLAALLTKETALLLPMALALALLLLARRRITARRAALLAACYGLILTGYWLLRQAAAAAQGEALAAQRATLPSTVCQLLTYCGKAFFPWDLSPFPMVQDTRIWPVMAGLAVGVFLLALALRDRDRLALYGTAWFMLFLLPAVAFTNGFGACYEHRLYIPMAGLCMALAGGNTHQPVFARMPALPALAVILLVAAGMARLAPYSRAYRSDRSFWEYSAGQHPYAAEVQYNLGMVYLGRGDDRRAA
ncbi:MAG TPA: glycosyltransferase family 39 protein, partial [Candidatus Edwardsbacteria bacterium]|nr:glycosyltransferase family 39 protein [Candidatus Edwardsbacteria bacterium]